MVALARGLHSSGFVLEIEGDADWALLALALLLAILIMSFILYYKD